MSLQPVSPKPSLEASDETFKLHKAAGISSARAVKADTTEAFSFPSHVPSARLCGEGAARAPSPAPGHLTPSGHRDSSPAPHPPATRVPLTTGTDRPRPGRRSSRPAEEEGEGGAGRAQHLPAPGRGKGQRRCLAYPPPRWSRPASLRQQSPQHHRTQQFPIASCAAAAAPRGWRAATVGTPRAFKPPLRGARRPTAAPSTAAGEDGGRRARANKEPGCARRRHRVGGERRLRAGSLMAAAAAQRRMPHAPRSPRPFPGAGGGESRQGSPPSQLRALAPNRVTQLKEMVRPAKPGSGEGVAAKGICSLQGAV